MPGTENVTRSLSSILPHAFGLLSIPLSLGRSSEIISVYLYFLRLALHPSIESF